MPSVQGKVKALWVYVAVSVQRSSHHSPGGAQAGTVPETAAQGVGQLPWERENWLAPGP